MLDFITSIYSKPTAQDSIKVNLQRYQRELVDAEELAAFNSKMAEFYREGIAHLQTQLDDAVIRGR